MSVWEYVFVFQFMIISKMICSDVQIQKQLIRENLQFIFIQHWLQGRLSQRKNSSISLLKSWTSIIIKTCLL